MWLYRALTSTKSLTDPNLSSLDWDAFVTKERHLEVQHDNYNKTYVTMMLLLGIIVAHWCVLSVCAFVFRICHKPVCSFSISELTVKMKNEAKCSSLNVQKWS